MFCMKCGEAIPDGSKVCPKCGIDLLEEQREQAVVYASQKTQEAALPPAAEKKPLPKKWVWIGGAIAVIAVLVLIIGGVQKSNLKKNLQKKWVDTDGTILKVLEFDEKEAEYRLETGFNWIDTTLFKGDYKVISGHKIKINQYGSDYRTYTIEFNDKKTIMTVTPAVTSTDDSEKWYDLE